MARPIDQIRKDVGLTVAELLQKAGVSRRAYYGARDGRNSNADTVRRLCEALGVERGEVSEFRLAEDESYSIEFDALFTILAAPAAGFERHGVARIVLREVLDRLPPEVAEPEIRAWYERRAAQKEEELQEWRTWLDEEQQVRSETEPADNSETELGGDADGGS